MERNAWEINTVGTDDKRVIIDHITFEDEAELSLHRALRLTFLSPKMEDGLSCDGVKKILDSLQKFDLPTESPTPQAIAEHSNQMLRRYELWSTYFNSNTWEALYCEDMTSYWSGMVRWAHQAQEILSGS